jgi:hypothetical protein
LSADAGPHSNADPLADAVADGIAHPIAHVLADPSRVLFRQERMYGV